MKSEKISRRDFLKLSGLGLAGLFAPPLNFHFDDPFTDLAWTRNHTHDLDV